MKSDKYWNKVIEEMGKNNRERNGEKELTLGQYYTDMIWTDIKHLSFTISRYKFVSKLLMYKSDVRVLELGCQEALGAILLDQNIDLLEYVGIDFDKSAIEWNQKNLGSNMKFYYEDFFKCNAIEEQKFDAVISLDVIEHISSKKEDEYCQIFYEHMQDDGVAIIGTPSINMASYASEESKVGHINLFNQERLYKLVDKYFRNVMIFNMNDEVVNVGFAPMSCYFFAVCCGKK